MRKKISDSQRLHSSDTAKGRSASVRVHSRSPRGNIKILSEEDLNTKKWLDIKIADINAREDAVDTLRKQFEQQLALLNRKEALERERSSMRSMRSVVTGESKGVLNADEEEAMQEIEDRIESVEGQLKLRNRNITEIQSKLGGDGSGQDVTVEALKNSIGSLPAAHELITLLFDMLVNSKATSKQRKTALLRVEGKERQLRIDLDDAGKRMNALVRAHDIELTRSANEYEDKMLGLFSHSTIGQIVRMESGMRPNESTDSIVNNLGNFSVDEAGTFSAQNSFSAAGCRSHNNESANKIIVAASNEHCNLLRIKLDREGRRNTELQTRISELTHSTIRFQQDLEEKNVLIKFLEDERTLFRDMADRLRAGISVLGGTAGEIILSQMKEDEDSDDDCDGFKGEFTNLGDIIHRNGSIHEKAVLTSTSGSGTSAAASRDVVYDRLTNPSNFTGAMKNAFGDDLLKKRQNVQMIKSSHPPKRVNVSHTKTDSLRITKDMIPTLSENSLHPSNESSPVATSLSTPRRSPTSVPMKDISVIENKVPVATASTVIEDKTSLKLNKLLALSSSTLSSASSHYSSRCPSNDSSPNSSYASIKCDVLIPEGPTDFLPNSSHDSLSSEGPRYSLKKNERQEGQESDFVTENKADIDVAKTSTTNNLIEESIAMDICIQNQSENEVQGLLAVTTTAPLKQMDFIPVPSAVEDVIQEVIKLAEFEKNEERSLTTPAPSTPRSDEPDHDSATPQSPPQSDSSPSTKRGIGGMMRKLWGKKKSFVSTSNGSAEADSASTDVEQGSGGAKGSLFHN